jgi:hypothetical protein
MPGTPAKQLASFIQKFTPEIASLARPILAKMRTRYPTALELVYDNYNALAIGFGPTERPSEAIFSIALFPRWIHLFFLQAKGLPDPEKRLQGSGSVAKHPPRLTSHIGRPRRPRAHAASSRESESPPRPPQQTSPHHQIHLSQTTPKAPRGSREETNREDALTLGGSLKPAGNPHSMRHVRPPRL